ncbi:hypothetical protein BGT96224_Ac31436 [Blumeria graminis f. sp. tritici 96224]|uniref:Uncharacterized protein n=1 Tax=Blumeria graminis f. sp. tritici 96224 TaxID=1268274 RepID=A0A656KNJ8_BLUGR|nr:hypothetical protein BGT96224_Ac31436 [Blumeria graminis f. sp. tritici 96224]
MSGVGGKGPRITHDITVRFRFNTLSGLTSATNVSCGVVPYRIFPGNITFGPTIFHAWGMLCNGNGSITLTAFNGKPEIFLIKPCKSHLVTESVYSSWQESKHFFYSLGKGTPTDNTQVQVFINEYINKYPGLFNSSSRKMDILSKFEHSINTSNAAPIKFKPRQYSPA